MQMPIASTTMSVQRGCGLRQRDAAITIRTAAATAKPAIAIHSAQAPWPTYQLLALIAVSTRLLKLVNRAAFVVRSALIRSRMFESRSGPESRTESKTSATDVSHGSSWIDWSPVESSRSETCSLCSPPHESCSVVTGVDL